MFVQLVPPAVCVFAIWAVNRHLHVGRVRTDKSRKNGQKQLSTTRMKMVFTLFTFSVGLRLGAGEGWSGFAKGVVGSRVSPAGKTIPGGSGERVGGCW